MAVRISTVKEAGRMAVHVEGRLEAPDALELQSRFVESDPPPTLDLTGLLSADETSLAVLIAMRDVGARLTGASAYVRYLLEVAAKDDNYISLQDAPSAKQL